MEEVSFHDNGAVHVQEPPRLSFAGQHTSLLLAPRCVVDAAHAILRLPVTPPSALPRRAYISAS